MSQNTPPENGPYDRRDVPPARNPGDGTQPENNPYFNRAEAQADPDLDAAAPRLRTVEERRLDRKALLFLGGILLLVIAMGFLLLRKGGEAEPERAPRSEARTTTPELPSVAATPQPQASAQADAIPLLPPEPASQESQQLELLAQDPMPRAPREPTLLERRIAAAEALGGGQGQPSQGGVDPATRAALVAQLNQNQTQANGGDQSVRRGADVEDISNASYIRSPDALLVRGTYLRCVLETRIITDVPGYTSCLVTEPVYSINGRTLLLPKGSKIYGSYGGGPVGERVDVIWDRITTPNGIDVAMSSPGTDGLGGAGVPGQYTAHWGKRLTSALMISLLADAFKYAAAENGPETTTIGSNGFAVQSPYESATARTMERLANEALSQRPQPTVTVNQGTVMNVYVAKDVDFSAVLSRRM